MRRWGWGGGKGRCGCFDFLPFFGVLSGPCTLAAVDDHMCVGRWPGGYLPDERCEIAVAGAGGTLGPCPVFDLNPCGHDDDLAGSDALSLPDGSVCNGEGVSANNCPAGLVLASGVALSWASNSLRQGNNENGLPHIEFLAGGGW